MKNEEFEKWAYPAYSLEKRKDGNYKSKETRVACAGYQSRQPEINALREKIEGKDRVIATMRRVEEILRGDLEKMFEKNAALQAEVERLRKLYLSKAEGLDATEAAMKEMK